LGISFRLPCSVPHLRSTAWQKGRSLAVPKRVVSPKALKPFARQIFPRVRVRFPIPPPTYLFPRAVNRLFPQPQAVSRTFFFHSTNSDAMLGWLLAPGLTVPVPSPLTQYREAVCPKVTLPFDFPAPGFPCEARPSREAGPLSLRIPGIASLLYFADVPILSLPIPSHFPLVVPPLPVASKPLSKHFPLIQLPSVHPYWLFLKPV